MQGLRGKGEPGKGRSGAVACDADPPSPTPMSLSVHSPYLGHKRLLGEREDSPDSYSTSSPKRLRRFSSSPSGRCGNRRETGPHRPSSPLATLRTLFPHMDSKVVADVLDSCGNNIDEAIKLLGALQLSRANRGTPQGKLTPNGSLEPQARTDPSQTSAASSQGGDASRVDAGGAEPPAKLPAEWVEGMVQQMSSASNLADARVRAANELRAFEQAVMQTTNKARDDEILGLQARVVELNKENTLLKRAVAIQQSRLQEAGAANKSQSSQAESIITDLQGKVHALEMSNYSLSLHLRQATSTQQHNSSHPDIF